MVDAAGGALLPGLHDHHVHLMAMAAARDSVDVGTAGLAALRTAPGDDWVRAVGYHESIAGPLDRDASTRSSPTGRSACSTARARCGCSTARPWRGPASSR